MNTNALGLDDEYCVLLLQCYDVAELYIIIGLLDANSIKYTFDAKGVGIVTGEPSSGDTILNY